MNILLGEGKEMRRFVVLMIDLKRKNMERKAKRKNSENKGKQKVRKKRRIKGGEKKIKRGNKEG